MSEINQQPAPSWTPKQVYTMTAICIVVGLVFGYLLRGTASTGAKTPVVAGQPAQGGMPPQMGQGQAMPSMDDMKRMADKAAEPLLAQLKGDPKNAQLLIKIGNTYKSAHQFPQAADYYQKALQLNPKDIPLRDEVGADLYYAGEVDQAIATFEEGLKISPNDPSTLLDLGLVKFRKKGDTKGAVELWQRLLANNPGLSADKKDQVEKLIAQAKTGKPLGAN